MKSLFSCVDDDGLPGGCSYGVVPWYFIHTELCTLYSVYTGDTVPRLLAPLWICYPLVTMETSCK